MKKFLVSSLIFINIFVLFGLIGLVVFQFKQIIDRSNEINRLNDQILAYKNIKTATNSSGQTSASTQASLQILPEDQTTLLDSTMKQPTGKASIKVYFSKNPDSNNDFSKVFSVARETDRKDVATFAVSELIKGPNASESSQNLFSPIKLSGPSNCGINDFIISIVDGKATIKFCKAINSAGVGDDARVKSVIEATVKQFPSVQKVVILNNNDTCFGDLSGQNLCKSK
jgi:spore germination protein GerM